jgi:hypothetical protein
MRTPQNEFLAACFQTKFIYSIFQYVIINPKHKKTKNWTVLAPRRALSDTGTGVIVVYLNPPTHTFLVVSVTPGNANSNQPSMRIAIVQGDGTLMDTLQIENDPKRGLFQRKSVEASSIEPTI